MKPDLLISLIVAAAGGFADAGSYMLAGSFTGHVTGNTLLAVIGIASRQWSQAIACILAVVTFLCGTALGSVWPRPVGHGPVGRLILPLALEMALIALGIVAGALFASAGRHLLVLCVCLALGLQNGVLNKVGPVSIRSTYITGMSTSLVASLAGTRDDMKRKRLSAVIGCFVAGAMCGAFLVSRAGLFGLGGILVPLTLAFGLAIAAPRDVES